MSTTTIRRLRRTWMESTIGPTSHTLHIVLLPPPAGDENLVMLIAHTFQGETSEWFQTSGRMRRMVRQTTSGAKWFFHNVFPRSRAKFDSSTANDYEELQPRCCLPTMPQRQVFCSRSTRVYLISFWFWFPPPPHPWYERNGAMLLWIVYFKFLLKTDRVCDGAVPFEPTCQTGSSLCPRFIISFLSFKGLFFQSVLKSHLLPSLVPPSFPRLQSDNFPQQKIFLPHST